MAELLPIKFFSKREEDKQRVEGNSSRELPKWVLVGDELEARALHLSDRMDELIDGTKWESRTVPIIVQASLIKDAHAKSHRRKIASVFETKKNNILGVRDEGTLIVKVDALDDALEMQKRLQDVDNNAYGISGIDEIERFHPSVEYAEGQVNYKVKLFDFHDYSANQGNCMNFERLLHSKRVDYSRADYSRTLVIYKLRNLEAAELDDLLQSEQFELAEEIIPMPSFDITLDSLDSQIVVPVKYPDVDKKSTVVGVLDDGIKSVNHLCPWIYGKRISAYPDSYVLSTHGTFVAGVITYGDELQKKEMTGSNNIKVFDGAVFPDMTKEHIEEDELIANIREVIGQKHQEIKVWNLSISGVREISDSKFSDFAMALDAIQDELNVLICKSAGNCTNFAAMRRRVAFLLLF